MARKKSKPLPPEPDETLDEDLDEDHPRPKVPALRAALFLYLLVIPLTWGVLSAEFRVQTEFMRLLIAPLIAAALTIGVIIVNGYSFGKLFGARKYDWRGILAGLLVGMLLYLPTAWLLLIGQYLLTTVIGAMPVNTDLLLQTGKPLIQVIGPVAPFLLPIGQGLLFWAFIQRGAESIGRIRAALLTALLFALFAMFSTYPFWGLLGVLAYLPLGLAAAFIACYTESALAGIAVTFGHMFVVAVFQETKAQQQLFQALGAEAATDLIDVKWLMAALLLGFAAFVVVQIVRVVLSPAEGEAQPAPRVRPQFLWWAPLILVVLLYALIGYGELSVRTTTRIMGNSATTTPTPNTSGSTRLPIPALPPTLTPTPRR